MAAKKQVILIIHEADPEVHIRAIFDFATDLGLPYSFLVEEEVE